MKILHLLYSHSFSGAENIVSLIINATNDVPGFDSIYCSPIGSIKDTLEAKGVPYLGINKVSLKEVKRAIEIYQPDVIHAHGTIAGFMAALACGRRKLVLHIHNNSKDSGRLSLKSMVNLLPFIKAKQVIWVSKDCLDYYLFGSLVKKKSSVISNGIDLSQFKFSKRKTNRYKLVMVSRFAPAKDQQTVIKAMSFLDQRYHLYLIGDGPLIEDSKRMVSMMQLDQRVHFLGARSDIAYQIGDAFVGIQSSNWEGFGMSALEFMACGIPVIASDVEGLKQVVEGAGVLFKKGDAKDLSEKIRNLSTDNDYYEKIATKCKDRANNYSI